MRIFKMADKKVVNVGDEIEAMCGKCKDATVHVVESIKNDKVTKVMCKSCHSSHRYRKPEDATAKTKTKKSTTKTKKKPVSPKTKAQRKWTRLVNKVEGDGEEVPKDYEMSDSYEHHDVIQHDKFGKGVVVDVIDPTKISVVFEEGEKRLVHNKDA